MRQLKSANRFSCDFTGGSGKKYTIYYVSKSLKVVNYIIFQFQHNKDCSTKTNAKNRSSISMTAVFPEYMNKNLAEKQANKLLNYVLKEFIWMKCSNLNLRTR